MMEIFLFFKHEVAAAAIGLLPWWNFLVGFALSGLLLVLIYRTPTGSRHECYLVDFACYKPPPERQVNTELSVYFQAKQEPLDLESLDFQWKIYLRSGLGEETSVCGSFFKEGRPEPSLEEAREEMEESFGAVLDDLFAKTNVKAAEIDILIANVSTFSPTPSLVAWVVNRYKMREDVKSFNLSGMGCSANQIAAQMGRDILKTHPNSYVLVVGSESLTHGLYEGTDKSFMLGRCLFRVGGYAILLSNKPGDRRRAKMRLVHTVRTNIAANDEAYTCVMTKEDEQGFFGIGLHPALLTVATNAVKTNLSALGPKVLPIREMLYYAFVNFFCIGFLKMKREPYVPNFRLAFQHFCIHPGGRAVISGIGKNLRLSEYDLEASRMALFRFGNTSTSGLWYEVAYLEAKRRLKVGDRVLQISLGSGFKCNTAVWEVLRDTYPSESTLWDDCIHRFPCSTRKDFSDDYCRKLLQHLPSYDTIGTVKSAL
ncbi:hypothetical protein SUGI_0101360 [Cryptomeria japonica]|nr:hypothetical protein SUGI_0101360 [Cryptomeria japonica]